MLGKLAAQKAKDGAEDHFKLQNLDMAIRFIKAAMDFDPELQGINEFYAAYMVHKIVSSKKSYYGILGIADRSADISTIKHHYKTLALALHPDKNKSIAAESAFKIVNEAWNVLSDPNKRLAYDHRMAFKPAAKRTSSSSSSGQAAPNPTFVPTATMPKSHVGSSSTRRRVVVVRRKVRSPSSTDQARHDSSRTQNSNATSASRRSFPTFRTKNEAEPPLKRCKACCCVC